MKFIDFFSGIGGFALGLDRAGHETIAFCECDKAAQKVLRKNFPHIPILEDITNVHFKNGFLYDSKVCIYIGDEPIGLAGGPPCQDVSIAGKKRGFRNEKGEITRSGLWIHYKRLIEEIRPRVVIVENVRNLLNIGFTEILKDFNNLGFNAEWEVISARSLGANHKRERVWLIAFPSNCDLSGFWEPFTSEEEKQKWRAETASRFGHWWPTRPEFLRSDDGISPGLYKGNEPERFRKARVKQLGNAVIPFIPELIGLRLNDYYHKRFLCYHDNSESLFEVFGLIEYNKIMNIPDEVLDVTGEMKYEMRFSNEKNF